MLGRKIMKRRKFGEFIIGGNLKIKNEVVRVVVCVFVWQERLFVLLVFEVGLYKDQPYVLRGTFWMLLHFDRVFLCERKCVPL